MTRWLIAIVVLIFTLPVSAQNLCEDAAGPTALTVPAGTPTRVGFCHDVRDVNGDVIVQPVFVALLSTPAGAPLGELTLTVTEIGTALPDGRRWFESAPNPATQSVQIAIVASNSSGRSLPSTALALTVTSGPLVPAAVTVPRILR